MCASSITNILTPSLSSLTYWEAPMLVICRQYVFIWHISHGMLVSRTIYNVNLRCMLWVQKYPHVWFLPCNWSFSCYPCGFFVCWLLNIPATCKCISWTDLLRQFTCCHTEIEAAHQTFHLTHSQYTDIGPTIPSANPMTPGAWQGSHWSTSF